MNAFQSSTLRGALYGAVMATLAGCAVGPDYRPDAPALPLAYQAQAALAQRAATAPMPSLDDWWNGFGDPELVRIVERVLVQNLDLSTAMARVVQARAAANEAGAHLLPQAELDGSFARQRQSLEGPIGKIASPFPAYNRNQSLEDLGVGASWELDLFGGLRRGAQAAGAEAQAAEAQGAGVRISVAAEAADAYFRLRGYRARIALTQSQIDTNQGLVDLVATRLDKGVATNLELAQARALLSQARAALPPLQIGLALQANRLDVLMGAVPGTYAAELASASADYVVPAIEAGEGPAELLRRRPDVIAAERRVAASSARIGTAVAEFYPKFSLSALLGFESLSAGAMFEAASFQPTAVLGLRWRLFDFGRVDAEVARAKGANVEALAQYRQSMLRATEDVENAVVRLTRLEQQARELRDEVDANVEARASAQEQYKAGVASLINVLDADRQLLAARDALAQAHADDARAAVEAFRALGGGWTPSAAESHTAGQSADRGVNVVAIATNDH